MCLLYHELPDVVTLSDVAVAWLSTKDVKRDPRIASNVVDAVYRYTEDLEQEVMQKPEVISSLYRIYSTVKAPKDENRCSYTIAGAVQPALALGVAYTPELIGSAAMLRSLCRELMGEIRHATDYAESIESSLSDDEDSLQDLRDHLSSLAQRTKNTPGPQVSHIPHSPAPSTSLKGASPAHDVFQNGDALSRSASYSNSYSARPSSRQRKGISAKESPSTRSRSRAHSVDTTPIFVKRNVNMSPEGRPQAGRAVPRLGDGGVYKSHVPEVSPPGTATASEFDIEGRR